MSSNKLINILKYERNITNNWIPGTLNFKEESKYVFVQTFNKESGYFLLVRDLYNNNWSYYDAPSNNIIYQRTIALWNQSESNKDSLSFIRSNRLYIHSHYLYLYLLKKQIRRFFRLISKPSIFKRWKKNTKPVIIGFNNNIKLYYIKTLLTIILKISIVKQKNKASTKFIFLFFYLKFLKLYANTNSSNFVFYINKTIASSPFVKYKERKRFKGKIAPRSKAKGV